MQMTWPLSKTETSDMLKAHNTGSFILVLQVLWDWAVALNVCESPPYYNWWSHLDQRWDSKLKNTSRCSRVNFFRHAIDELMTSVLHQKAIMPVIWVGFFVPCIIKRGTTKETLAKSPLQFSTEGHFMADPLTGVIAQWRTLNCNQHNKICCAHWHQINSNIHL